MMKRIILLFFLCMMIGCGRAKATSQFIETMDDVFVTHEKWIVFDKSGNDITDIFVEENMKYYETKDYQYLYDFCGDEEIYFQTKPVVSEGH